MTSDPDQLIEDLTDAWQDLQIAHYYVEGSDVLSHDFHQRLQDLDEAVRKYWQMIDQLMKG